MNIFVLDLDPEKAAQYHCDKHVVKMILETAQILSTVVQSHYHEPLLYRATHKNHPCVIWAGQSWWNIFWLGKLGRALCREFEFRYGKKHKSEVIINKALDASCYLEMTGDNEAQENMTPFAQAMPEQYRDPDPVKAYRNYYKNEKAHLLTYTKREKPSWLE